MSPRSDKLRSALLLSAFSVSLILTQSGCPQGAELENQDAWAGRFGAGTGSGATGGTAPTAGTGNAAGTATGGAGTGGGLDFSKISCPAALDNANTAEPAAADFLNSTCAKRFCHGKDFVVGLDLRPDSGFVMRTVDVIATHAGIPCPDDVTMECIPDTCPPAGTTKIIDSGNPTASWILTKAHGMQMDCGDPMPDSNATTGDKDTCLTAIVNAAAAAK